MPKVLATRRFIKDLKKIPLLIKRKTDYYVRRLRIESYRGLDITKLKGFKKRYYRLKVSRNYRLVYSFKRGSIILHRIKHRREIYKINF